MTGRDAIVIGGFYETPNGRIARTHGWDGPGRQVSYTLDDGAGPRTAAESEVLSGWARRPDLADFPAARDPLLPPVFDLLWDVKRRSALVALLADGEHEAEVRRLMAENGLVLTTDEEDRVESLRADAANDAAMGM